MRLSLALVVFRKELLETLRDRATLISIIVLPLFVYPLLTLLGGQAAIAEFEAREEHPSRVAVWGEIPPDIRATLEEGGKVQLLPWHGVNDDLRRTLETETLFSLRPGNVTSSTPSAGDTRARKDPTETARQLTKRREVDAVLVPQKGFSENLDGGGRASIIIFYDSVWGDSDVASDRLTAALKRARSKALAAREKTRDLPDGFTEAIVVAPLDVAIKERQEGKLLGSAMPMMLILMAVLGGFLRAAEMTAGEKERGTMQTLLCAPLLPLEIITGKFLAVFVVSLTTSLFNVIGLALTFGRIMPGGSSVPLSSHALAFALLVPISFLFAALCLAVASFARDFKDAQNLLSPLLLPVMALSMLAILPGMELSGPTSFVPVLNVALLIKAIYLGQFIPDLVLYTLGSSCLFAALALVFAARVFDREDVRVLGRGSFREVLRFPRQKGGTPTPAYSLASFAVILVVVFYASLLIEKNPSKTVQLLGSQALMVVPALALIVVRGASMRETLALNMPKPRALLGALLVGLSASAVISSFAMRLVPVPRAVADKVGEAALLDGKPIWLLVLLVAVVPALCEETLFRGLLQSGLSKVGPAVAILAPALLFGFMHGSVYRFLPTALLGMVLGYARLTSGSLIPGIIIHAANNALIVTLLTLASKNQSVGTQAEHLPGWIALIAAGTLAVGLLLIRRSSRAELA